jgi:hypothetical protein
MSSFAEAQTRDANAKLVHKSMLAKANFSGGSNEASVLFSFSNVLPALVRSSHLVVDAKFMLPRLKNLSDWYLEGHIDGISVYSRWSKACSGYSSTLVRELDRCWNRLDQVELCAVGLDFPMRTKAFIKELNTFVKEFRTELLIKEDGADEEETWSLLLAMLSAIFKTMSAARAEAGDKPEDNPDLDSRPAKVFWGTWQCHRVMSQLLQVGFRKHPCVLPALTLHLFARKASSSKVNKMVARMAILEKSAKGYSDHGVSQKAFDLFCSRTVEPLAKQIKALESKS